MAIITLSGASRKMPQEVGALIESPGFYENLTAEENLRLLILDEPMNGLDPVGVQEIRDYLQRINKISGITILISSHLLGEVEQLADVVGIMRARCPLR